MSSAKDNDNLKDWSDDLKSMSTDEIRQFVDQALSVLKKRDAKKSDEKPASELTDEELNARFEKLGSKKG